jgi:hypothetical protein
MKLNGQFSPSPSPGGDDRRGPYFRRDHPEPPSLDQPCLRRTRRRPIAQQEFEGLYNLQQES